MIINNIHIEPNQIKEYTALRVDLGDKTTSKFPLLKLDRDTYIASAEIQSGINFDPQRVIHNLQIGRYCSLADKITFMIGLNHDYEAITTGVCSFLTDIKIPSNNVKKHQIILQNDVWIGSGATIMSGVTVHNGAVIACNAHIVKDVPPYAIVGGNPAKVLKYRFNPDQINKLQKIAWWDWSLKKLTKNAYYFGRNIDEFINEFYDEVVNLKIPSIDYTKKGETHLFFCDLNSEFSITEHVIRNFCETYDSNNNVTLLIYINPVSNANMQKDQIHQILKKLKLEQNDSIEILIDKIQDERSLFQIADYYITNRQDETVRRTCYADQFGVKTLSGVDDPVFHQTH